MENHRIYLSRYRGILIIVTSRQIVYLKTLLIVDSRLMFVQLPRNEGYIFYLYVCIDLKKVKVIRLTYFNDFGFELKVLCEFYGFMVYGVWSTRRRKGTSQLITAKHSQVFCYRHDLL